MKTELTRFDFHVFRWLNSEAVQRMWDKQCGQYLNLLAHSWAMGNECLLVPDHDVLKRLARVQRGGVDGLVIDQFDVVETPNGKRLRNSVLYAEWQEAQERSRKARESANLRHNKHANA
jgi:hypothetical protein